MKYTAPHTVAAVVITLASTAHANTIDLDELNPADRPAYGDASNTGFNSGGATFNTQQWSGWTYSDDNDTTTPGFTNQYAAYTGTDVSGSGNYAIASGSSTIDLPAGQTALSVRVTNTTYAALSMLNGDSFAKAFGGESGDDPDYFDVIFTGKDNADQTTGTVTFRLADYTFADNSQDYIVDSWQQLDLTPLGDATSIQTSWASTDGVGDFINTPRYVAIDNLTLVPEPGSAALLALAGLLATRRRR